MYAILNVLYFVFGIFKKIWDIKNRDGGIAWANFLTFNFNDFNITINFSNDQHTLNLSRETMGRQGLYIYIYTILVLYI